MSAAAVRPLPMVLTEVEATSVTRLSPSFVRVELSGPELADLGVDGPWLDQRVKLVFPYSPAHPLASFVGAGEDWWVAWRDLEPEERGHMRTYTVRDVRGYGVDTRLVIDFVVHEDGLAGPGASWALAARPGDRVVVIAPRRGEHFGGIEFTPGDARSLLLVGDESAVPAVAGILAGLPCDAVGAAYLEVPDHADIQDLPGPPGVEVCWLPRGHQEVGTCLVPEVRSYLGLPRRIADDVRPDDPTIGIDLWETPAYSGAGESLDVRPSSTVEELDGVFAWIAGESAMVTRLRRAMVKELGVDRRQVAFMGYWRRGVAMMG